MQRIVLLIMSIFILVTGCNRNEESVKYDASKEYFKTFEKYGEIHNQFLSNLQDNFNPDIQEVTTLYEGIQRINQFNLKYTATLNIPEEEKKLLCDELTKMKHFVYTPLMYDELFCIKTRNTDGSEVEGYYLEYIQEAYRNELIDFFEYEKLLLLGEKAKANISGTVTNDEFETFIYKVKEEWLIQGYTEESKYGKTLAYALSISLASIEWWQINTDALPQTRALPAAIALDAAGAAIGAVIGAVSSYAGNGEVNWTSVGVSAVGGAITGSLGMVGKAAKWLSKLF